jgi:8-oxo-dGTP pyrophosphatase MutT (NUDIX family)
MNKSMALVNIYKLENLRFSLSYMPKDLAKHSKLPKSAAKVFDGELFDVYQWPQTMYDGSTVTFERVSRADIVTVLPVDLDRGTFLYSHQEQPDKGSFYALFGGSVDAGESHEQAATRELLEESGCTGDIKQFTRFNIGYKVFSDWSFHVAFGYQKVADTNPDNGEKIEVREAPLNDLLKIITDEGFSDIVGTKYILKSVTKLVLQGEAKNMQEAVRVFFGSKLT